MSHAIALNYGKALNRIQKCNIAVQFCTYQKNKKGEFLQKLSATEIWCN